MKSTEIMAALRAAYALPTWACAAEVSPSTGAGSYRRADFVAVNCYPSQGLEIHGVEVKISRGDWLRELKQPGKVEEGVYRFCDRWWVATAPDIVRPDELPPTWGLMELHGTRLKTVVKAPKLTPCPPDAGFLASMLRNSNKPGEAEVLHRIAQRVEEVRESYGEAQKRDAERHAEERRRLQDALTGMTTLMPRWVHMDDAERREVAGLLNLLQDLGPERRYTLLSRLEGQLTEILTSVQALRQVPAEVLQ